MSAATTRQQVIEAADRLFYERGFEATSFADIAGAVQISRGNFYYHFKTKDEILDAVIALRFAHTRAMLEDWETLSPEPAARIESFIHLLAANRASIMARGCPVGTLCQELAKLDHLARPAATGLFALFREWLARQFVALGHGSESALVLAEHLLARSQGVATLANAFRDEAFVAREVAALEEWLAALRPDDAGSREPIPHAVGKGP